MTSVRRTGASGFVGHDLAGALAAEPGLEVRGLVPPGLGHQPVEES